MTWNLAHCQKQCHQTQKNISYFLDTVVKWLIKPNKLNTAILLYKAFEKRKQSELFLTPIKMKEKIEKMNTTLYFILKLCSKNLNSITISILNSRVINFVWLLFCWFPFYILKLLILQKKRKRSHNAFIANSNLISIIAYSYVNRKLHCSLQMQILRITTMKNK